MDLRFAQPYFLLLLSMIPLLLFLELKWKSRRKSAVSFSNIEPVRAASIRSAEWSQWIHYILRAACLICIVLALARPQSGQSGETINTEGIDIVLALDVSSSMLAEDIEPNRLQAAKEVAERFIQGRTNDRIGLVIFSGQAFTQCPLTVDYGILVNLLEEIEVGIIEDGTAIGMGVGVAVNRLKDSSAESKVMVLLTDGRNNRGEIDPKTASQLAKTFGIRIYTVGAGTKGLARYPVDDPLFGRRYIQAEVDIDEDILKEVAASTGGRYFRATNRESLESIYHEIDQLEKTEIEVIEFTKYTELFQFPIGLSVVFLALEILLLNTRLRRIP